jgi:hypothetical protein|eukprot:CAMPEP_0198703006 /NCGR_PEP_ID=MMETSP1468-20131203/389095_1 /TAXON_ID=1461545 /ORGANISM="Mantoniella sp, Strain CCMP1436" /LENGTH=49 /DNA_ID=CAMNT_0044461639 /DNA_START=585 /DNA_END=734 /DNA_ORIENTATION=+
MTVNPTPSRQTLLLHRPEKGKAGAEAAQQGVKLTAQVRAEVEAKVEQMV